MIDNQTAINTIKMLAEQGFLLYDEGGTTKKKQIRITRDNLNYLNKHHSEGKHYKSRNGEILEAMIPGFLVSASKGEMLVSEQDIVNELGYTIEQNYPEASISFLKFAKTYWSLRVMINQLKRDHDGQISFIGGRLLGVLEGEIGPLFFPFPGPQKVSPDEREKFQRELLTNFAYYSPDIDINIEDFIRGNPILIRDRKAMSGQGGCLFFITLGVTASIVAILYGVYLA